MPKIIIDYDKRINPVDALMLVRGVIVEGRISTARGRDKYCHVTRFGTQKDGYTVIARDRRQDNAPDSFLIIPTTELLPPHKRGK